VDCRADLYSLGCVAYWMLTGRLVFEQKTPMAMLLAHLQTPPTPLSDRRADIPGELERVILSVWRNSPKDARPAPATCTTAERCDVRPGWANAQAETWWSEHMNPAVISSSALVRSTLELL
jgi:serine/threonine-protein kinase